MREVFIVGLGRMGQGIGRRLVRKGHKVGGFDVSQESREGAREHFRVFDNLSQISEFFQERKVVWLMVPHNAVDQAIQELMTYLDEGDILIDGGNSYYKESIRRYQELKTKGVHFLDVGVSGGVYGEELGYCLMVGGDRQAFDLVEQVFKDLSYGGEGYAYLGPSGAGHFAKMVHNGIEYAIMEAIGEGFELLKESGFNYDLREVARIYNTGSVIRSWLMELTQRSFEEFGSLEGVKPYVEDTGEGRWTTLEAVDLSVPAPVIALSLFMRFRSRQSNSFRDRLLAVLRYQFGRHAVKKDEQT
ncbi:phosphogluconate dehydrogenase (NAD(+)-dependent, decarboxylating) [Thermocrinis sp.]